MTQAERYARAVERWSKVRCGICAGPITSPSEAVAVDNELVHLAHVQKGKISIIIHPSYIHI